VRTQPWIADLQDEVITRCSGFWHLANMLPLDGEKAQAGFFRAGPVGAVVGGAVGAAVGTVGGILGVEDRPRFREYVVHEQLPSYRYSDDLRVGVVLPESGVTYYDVPADYHVTGYRYTYVNDRVVLVDPRTRRVIQIIE